MKKLPETALWILLSDLHHPEHCKTAFRATLSFIERNKEKIKGIVLLGDNMDCVNISRHTKGKPRLRTRGGIARDFARFDKDILREVESRINKDTEKIFFLGNHEDWLEQWLDENPEFEGIISFDKSLGLTKRGWEVIAQGNYRQVGKAYLLHGDQVGTSMHVAKKLVDSYCATAIMGHVHTASMYTKVSQIKKEDKWIGYTLPTLGTVAPKYAKGRPNSFVQGFGVLELWSNNFINVYIPIILDGKFSFGGEMYGA